MSDYPDVALEALRKLFPHPRKKSAEMECLRKALERLEGGEVDGTPLMPQEALAFLRTKLAEAGLALAGREKRFTPHLTTFLNQRKYLTPTLPPPENLEEAISILSCYPGVSAVDVDAHMPVLRVIDGHISYYRATHGSAAASYIRTRTARFAECVSRWPPAEMQYLVSPLRFYKERRYEQPEEFWRRNQPVGFESEREQLRRVM